MPKNKSKTFSFRCSHCHEWVISDEQTGTAHRNHCPFCLWSKHVDAEKPGDRKSTCGAGMAPIGLTFKKEAPKKYGAGQPGELMIIHECTQCGQLRINRLAADDNTDVVLQVFEQSQSLDERTRQRLQNLGINPLTQADTTEVRIQLFGSCQK